LETHDSLLVSFSSYGRLEIGKLHCSLVGACVCVCVCDVYFLV
jgi:hypothetical protein